ncbi:hypothetical protein L873DRAFT_1822116, partial [Choiromyces venosus 120613-1]
KKWRAKHPLKIPTRAKATPCDRVTLIAYSSLHWRCTPTFMFTHPHIVPHITTLLSTS